MLPRNRLKLPSASAKKQAEKRFLWNDARSSSEADFYTVGYMGRSLENLIDAFVSNGVQTLVDIRQNPASMYRSELSKGNLKRLMESNGLRYLHLPELGVPREIRAKAIGAGTRDVIWAWYDEQVVFPYLRNLHRFFNSIEHPAAMMCVEIDPHECHRHRLFLALERQGLRGFDL